ncbi:cysteine desulfurase family protein [Polaribacter dokdonensis]|uniref:cysteine desulfurase n=1 Tax=Polaribacter dokdonensis DSW-5 TaxID=1300348 RepID=A0A0N0CFT3_9FLAO|nr:cysteine desulfurase family protein [Polaribacter dokdonensis]KOY52270.1 Iron-sulfur cofactor synthesis protein [Polaribacter dokdonensis DSW-5]SEE42301.1 cysteine desulfurase [Polaribacter dokdonensis DSW-5]
MNAIYLDNAATTKIDDVVLKTVHESMQDVFGNPSSTHQFGRKAKSAVETARKNIAKHFNVTASEIVFTAGGTEADNLILKNAVLNLGVQTIITSKIEHHAVLHTCEFLEKSENISLQFVNVNEKGAIDLNHLEALLTESSDKVLVSLMHINNEIGTILPIEQVSALCVANNAYFHSDTVQTIGHYNLDLLKVEVDFIAASAHKFHGPKGVGFAYFKKGSGILPMFHGGDQERGARSSTENVHSILGMQKAMEIAYKNLDKDKEKIEGLKKNFIEGLEKISSEIKFNGCSGNFNESTYTILNVRFPIQNDMLLFSLDMAGIAVSGGSACQSGSNVGSHVLAEILSGKEADNTSVRFSFSKYTTKEELDITLKKIEELL